MGGIYDFLAKKEIDYLRELEKPAASRRAVEKQRSIEKSNSKISYEERKEQARRIKKLERSVADREKEIEHIEYAVDVVERKLGTPEGAADVTLYEEHARLKKSLDEAMTLWEKESEELEMLKNQS